MRRVPKGCALFFLSKFLGIPYAGKRWRRSLQLRQRRTLLRSNLRQAHCSRSSKIKTLANLLPAMSALRTGRGADIIRQDYFPHKDDSKHQPLPANDFPCAATSARYSHAIPWPMQLHSIVKRRKCCNVSLSSMDNATLYC